MLDYSQEIIKNHVMCFFQGLYIRSLFVSRISDKPFRSFTNEAWQLIIPISSPMLLLLALRKVNLMTVVKTTINIDEKVWEEFKKTVSNRYGGL